MKRIVPIFLLLAMLLSLAVLPASASEPAAADAPTVRAVQSAVNQEDATKYDIRFLATVSSLSGFALGMEIRATFSYNGETCSVEYGAADGLEGNTVYTSVKAEVNGEQKSVTAQELAGDEGAVAIYSAVLRGVPAETDVVFTLKAYLIDNGVKTESEVGVVTWKEGELTGEFGVVYQENFNDVVLDATLPLGNANLNASSVGTLTVLDNEAVNSFNQTLTDALGWRATSVRELESMTQTVKVTDGQVTMNGGATTFQLLGPDVLRHAQTYSVDMDIKANSIGNVLGLFFNNTTDVGQYVGSGQFIRIHKSGNEITVTCNSFARKEGTTNYAGQNVKTGTSYSTGVSIGETFHLTLLVDWNTATVTVLVNGKQLLVTDALHGGGGLEMHIQNVETVLDNLVVIAGGSEQADGTVLFEENFDTGYENGTAPYSSTEKIAGTIAPNATVEDGVMNAPAGSDLSVYRFATEADLSGTERYVLQMDVTTDNVGFFSLVFNGSNSHTYAAVNGGTKYLGTYNILQFRAIKPTGSYAGNPGGPLMANLLTYDTGTIKSYQIFGYVSADESASTATETRSYTFSFAMEVDKTAGRISLWIDGTLLGTVENSETETLVLNGFGGMYFWIQNTANTVTVDNIRIVAGAYTDLPKG